MDRATMVEANLKNAILQRTVFTRSDLKDAVIEGADFTNALLDKTQVMVSAWRSERAGEGVRQGLAVGRRRRSGVLAATVGLGRSGAINVRARCNTRMRG
mgnify:CR=1 FL=1